MIKKVILCGEQKGLAPVLTLFVGMGILACLLIYGIHYAQLIYLSYTSRIQEYGLSELINLVSLAPLLGTWIICATFACALAGAFPNICITKDGLLYRFLFFTHFVKWEDIEDIVSVKFPRCTAIVVSVYEKGFFLLIKLYFNILYGAILGISQPVILLSPGLENYEGILSEIKNRRSNLQVQ